MHFERVIVSLAALPTLLLLNGCFSSSVETPEEFGTPIETTEFPVEPIAEAIAEPAAEPAVKSAAEPVRAPQLVVYDAPSPNFDKRTLPISLIVLHYTATRNLSKAMNALRNPNGNNRVSCHYLVDTDGAIYRLVREEYRAWHAGVAFWNGIKDVNSASIGIEIVNRGPLPNGKLAGYPEAQIAAVIRLCQNIQTRHRIVDVVGHSDVAPVRKQDPGENFPWRRLAKAGVGTWTDDFAVPTLPDTALLSSIGYDASNFYFASQAFRRHYYPEGLTARGIDRTSARLAAVAAEFAKKRKR